MMDRRSRSKRPSRLLHRPILRLPLASMTAAYIRLLWRSGHWETRGDPEATDLIRRRVPCLGAFWHGRLLMVRWVWYAMLREAGRDPDTPAWCLISTHGDGAFIADAVARLGMHAVRGSSRRGGAGALREMRQLVEQGECVALATDGPRGPRMRLKPGILHLARSTGAPIIPLAFAASNQRLIRSWDRFALALPFARGLFAWGTPIHVPENADADAIEALRLRLETRITALTDELDRRLGLPTVEPAPALTG